MPRASQRDPFDDNDDKDQVKPVEASDEKEVEQVSTEPDPNEEHAGETEEQKEARRERRANRFKEAQEARQAAEAKAAELERQAMEATARAAAAEQVARSYVEYQRATQQPGEDPWKRAADQVFNKRLALRSQADELAKNNQFVGEARDKMMRAWQDTEVELQEIAAHKQLYIQNQQSQQYRPNTQAEAEQAAFNARLRSEFPDIIGDQRYTQHMSNTYFAMLAEGKPNTWQTAAAAAAHTRRTFRLNGPPAPDAVTKAKYAGVGGGANGGNGASNGKIPMLPKYKKMAHARFPDDPPAVAEKKWAQTAGRKILESEE